jgi:hypothetical protein
MCLIAASSSAQAAPSRFEVSVGPLWARGVRFAAIDAKETGAGGVPFRLFKSQSEVEGAVGIEGGAAIRVNRWLQVEAVASYGRPRLTTHVSGDFENAANIDITERTVQVAVQGGLVAHLLRWHMGPRGTPFVAAGGGYFRELHEGQTIVRRGGAYFAGAGFRYLLTEHARFTKVIGLKADLRAVVHTGGIALDERTHVTPAFGVSAFLGF